MLVHDDILSYYGFKPTDDISQDAINNVLANPPPKYSGLYSLIPRPLILHIRLTIGTSHHKHSRKRAKLRKKIKAKIHYETFILPRRQSHLERYTSVDDDAENVSKESDTNDTSPPKYNNNNSVNKSKRINRLSSVMSILSLFYYIIPSVHAEEVRVVQWELHCNGSCWYWSCCRCTCMCISMGSDSDEENTDNNVPINPIHNNLKQERAKLQCHYPRLQKDLLKD